jgi:hypothetical protein
MLQRIMRSLRRGSVIQDIRRHLGLWLHPPRRLASHAGSALGTNSSRRLNRLSDLLVEPRDYLEIGVETGRTFEAVDLPNRVAVEPNPRFSVTALPEGVDVRVKTSDDFFAELDPAVAFDLIFLDGLHTYEQTYRDLMQALSHSRPHSVILVDDVVPSDRVSAIRGLDDSLRERARLGQNDDRWHGDVFRLLLVLRDHHPDLRLRTIIDGGANEQTVIWQGNSDFRASPISSDELSRYQRYSYDDVFVDGVPDFFRPGTEDEVLADVAATLAT